MPFNSVTISWINLFIFIALNIGIKVITITLTVLIKQLGEISRLIHCAGWTNTLHFFKHTVSLLINIWIILKIFKIFFKQIMDMWGCLIANCFVKWLNNYLRGHSWVLCLSTSIMFICFLYRSIFSYLLTTYYKTIISFCEWII